MTLTERINALPTVPDPATGDPLVSREVVLAILKASDAHKQATSIANRPIHRMYKGGYTGEAGGSQ